MNEGLPKTASQIRYEQQLARLARERFYQSPRDEFQAIAKHYAAHALLALEILELLRMREGVVYDSVEAEPLEYLILNHIKFIKQNHLLDFGIQLEWHPNAEKNKQ